MSSEISNSESVKLLSSEYKSDRNKAIAKAVLATAVIVMGVVATYFMISITTTQAFISMGQSLKINVTIFSAAIVTGLGIIPLHMGMNFLVKAIKDVVKSNKLLKAVKDPQSPELEAMCETRKSALEKKVREINEIHTKLVSSTVSLENLAYGEGCKFDNLDTNTREKRAKERNFSAHEILEKNRPNLEHSMARMVIIKSAVGAVAAISCAIVLEIPLSLVGLSLIMPAAFTVIGVGLLFLPNRSWERVTQLDENKEYWKQELQATLEILNRDLRITSKNRKTNLFLKGLV